MPVGKQRPYGDHFPASVAIYEDVCRKKLYQSELQESGFLYQETIDKNYAQRDYHTMYVGKIEKVLVRDDEYLKV